MKVSVTAGPLKTLPAKSVNPNKKKSSKSKSKRKPLVPQWFNAVMDPFSHPPVGIPDEDTRLSHKQTSWYQGTQSMYRVGGDATPATGGYRAAIVVLPTPRLQDTQAGDQMACWYNANMASQTLESSGSLTSLANGEQLSMLSTGFPNGNGITPSDDYTAAGYATCSVQYRPTAFGIRVTPLQPELYRAGQVTTGFVDIKPTMDVAPLSGQFNPLGLVNGGVSTAGPTTISWATLKRNLFRSKRTRMPDGTIELVWIPRRVPKYRKLPSGTNNVSLCAQLYNEWSEAQGSIPIIMLETPSQADGTPPVFQIEMFAHWEITNVPPHTMPSMPTPSVYDVKAVEYCVNEFQNHYSMRESHQGFGEENVGTSGSSSASHSSVYDTITRTVKAAVDYDQNGRVDVNDVIRILRDAGNIAGVLTSH